MYIGLYKDIYIYMRADTRGSSVYASVHISISRYNVVTRLLGVRSMSICGVSACIHVCDNR